MWTERPLRARQLKRDRGTHLVFIQLPSQLFIFAVECRPPVSLFRRFEQFEQAHLCTSSSRPHADILFKAIFIRLRHSFLAAYQFRDTNRRS